MNDFRRFDYGYVGEKELGTEFWCVVWDYIEQNVLLVCADDGSVLEVPERMFHKVETIENEELIRKYVGKGKEITSTFMKALCSFVVAELPEEKKKVAEPKLVFVMPSKDLLDNAFVRLAVENTKQVNDNYSFTVGNIYPVYHGCLLDNDGSCCYDAIHSVCELNSWDKERKWELWDKTTPSELEEKAAEEQ